MGLLEHSYIQLTILAYFGEFVKPYEVRTYSKLRIKGLGPKSPIGLLESVLYFFYLK